MFKIIKVQLRYLYQYLAVKNIRFATIEELLNHRYHCYVNNLNNSPSHFNAIADLQSDQMESLSGFSMARWNVRQNSVVYCNSDSHTLSMYLSGGETTYRTDCVSLKGAPGKICLMPQGQDSNWHINGDIDFMHLYFCDEALRHYASTTLQTDVRFIELKDLLYEEDIKLKQLFIEYASVIEEHAICSPLFAEQAAHKILHHLLINHNGFLLKDHKIQGGLSPKCMRITRDYIRQNLDHKLTIELLSKGVNLSPFHFARMFKISFGESPANFITRSRVERVKSFLNTAISLATISAEVGFSQQSHMTNSFKKLVGITPAAFRKRIM